MFAPVVLFTYTRFKCLQETVVFLQKNLYASETRLFIYSDAAKNSEEVPLVQKVRDYLKTISGFKSVHIIEREVNMKLEYNVIQGVSEIVHEYGRVIVLEDDIQTSPFFLKYMNDALELYEKNKKVMHINAFNSVPMPSSIHETFLSFYMDGWGWGTWKDRWAAFRHFQSEEDALYGFSGPELDRLSMNGTFDCFSPLKLRPIPWDICWYFSIARNHGLCLTPRDSMTKNRGLLFGTHFKLNFSSILYCWIMRTRFARKAPSLCEQEFEENYEAENIQLLFWKKYHKVFLILRFLSRIKQKIKKLFHGICKVNIFEI